MRSKLFKMGASQHSNNYVQYIQSHYCQCSLYFSCHFFPNILADQKGGDGRVTMDAHHSAPSLGSIFTAREGNLFTPVCHSVHRGDWVPCRGGVLCLGDLRPGGLCQGGLCRGGGGLCPGRLPHTVCAGGTHPTGMHSFHAIFRKYSAK